MGDFNTLKPTHLWWPILIVVKCILNVKMSKFIESTFKRQLNWI